MQYGHFNNIYKEYIIDKPDVLVSWKNYLGTKNLFTVISHNAGGYTFYKSTEHGRITRFRANSIPLDRPGHYLYLKNYESEEFWSISWQPNLKKASYRCCHGLSYSKFQCKYADIQSEQLLFIPLDDDVELWDVKIKNTGTKKRNIGIFSYIEFSFQHIEIDNQNLQMSLCRARHPWLTGTSD